MAIIPKHIDKLYIVMGNTDLTEGRGGQFAKHICLLETTARRLGKGKYVQGTDCPVIEVPVLWFTKDAPYIPLEVLYICEPTKEDKLKQEAINRRQEVIVKLMELGVTDEELAIVLDNPYAR